MKFPESFIDEVKATVVLSDYIGRTVQLKRQGREYVGLSPFNREKTPSFCVNDEKRFWCDFSSGKTGDIVDWVKETSGLSFVESVKRLAQEHGIPVPQESSAQNERDARRQHLEGVLGAAQNYFTERLLAVAGREARAYLERRGLGAADWSRFGIGYAPNERGGLMEHLRRAGYSPEDAVSAGVAIQVDGQRPYDRYRDRVTFPISSASGRPISFGGRALSADAKAKYLNGPDTELFDKGRNLYGLDISRQLLARGPGPLLVAEGYMDVVACLRAGIAACAPMGTSLTDAQLELAWKFHPEPTLCFDSDAAGRRASVRAMDMVLPKLGPRRSVRFSIAVGGKDPDEVLRTQGADALRSQLGKATPLAEAIFLREHSAQPLDTPEQRADLRRRLDEVVAKIGDRELAREYRDHFRRRLDALRSRGAAAAPASEQAVASARALRDAPPPVSSALAYWIVKDPERAADEIETLHVGFGHPKLDRLAKVTADWMLAGDITAESLAQHLSATGLGDVAAGLIDHGGRLRDREAWRRCWRAWVNFRRICIEIEAQKARLNTPEDMSRFLSLKAQRDEARRAL